MVGELILDGQKKSRNSRTYYYDETGEIIKFNPGIIWVQVVNIDPNINIE